MKTALIIIFMSVSGLFSGTVLYVNAGATGNNNGKTWQNAYVLLESALFAAFPGQEIWVAKGTYYPTFDYGLGLGDRGKHFRLKNGVKVYGGFAGGETLLSQRNVITNVCVLSGDIGTPGVNTDNCYHVIYNPDQNPDIDNTAELDGFTISSGYDAAGSGGGILNNFSSPVIRSCIITGCHANYGGGIYNYQSSPLIENCTVKLNSASFGAGICNYEASNSVINYCTIRDNNAMEGGGIYNFFSSPAISNCYIGHNSATGGGGGIVNNVFNPVIRNCNLTGNAANYGGGVFNNCSNPTFEYCAVELNSAVLGGGMYNNGAGVSILSLRIGWNSAQIGGGFYNSEGTVINMVNSLIYKNTASENGGSSFNDSTNVNSTNCTTILKSGMKGKAHTPSGPYSQSCSNLKDYACISWHDPADSIMVYIDPTSTMEMNFCCYDFSESEISGGGVLTEGMFNIHSDPFFADPVNEDYRLPIGSPCVDAGNNNYNSMYPYDIRGEGYPRSIWRNGDPGRSDIGAYEYNITYDPDILMQPGDVAIIRNTESTQLSWTAPLGGASYKIYRSTDPYSGFMQISTSPTNSYTDSEVLAGNKYFYYVIAVSAK